MCPGQSHAYLPWLVEIFPDIMELGGKAYNVALPAEVSEAFNFV
jgi:hypothetical protein